MTDTVDTTAPVDGPPPGRRRRRRRWWLWLLVVLIVLVGADIAAVNINLPEYVLAPGVAVPVGGMITVPASKRHPFDGAVLMTAVYTYQARPIDVARSWFDSDIQVVPASEITGGLSNSQFQHQSTVQMTSSEEAAQVVALRRLGYPVTEHGTGAQVALVEPKTPAAGQLAVGDTITAVNGTPTPLETDAAAVLRAIHPGGTATMTVQDTKGATRTVTVVLASRPGSPGKGYLGVGLTTRDEKFDFPFNVKIDAQGIGGPSAGLAFTLGLLDTLTTGHLTGGAKVAATGTMSVDGTVGDVGGVAQKAVSVRQAGAKVFLVPTQEYRAAKSHAGSMRVVAVANLQQALNVLQGLGGDVSALPGGAPTGQ